MNAPADLRLRVTPLDHDGEVRWEAFVAACPEATFFHRVGWKRVIERSFGHDCHYLVAESGGAVRGILPLVHVKSRLFGNALISNAFCVYGGPVATDETTRGALVRRAEGLADDLGVDYLEFRNRAPSQPDWASNSTLYAGFRKSLDPDPDKNLLAVRRKQRAMVRKGIKLGLAAEIDPDTDRFFSLYAASVRNLGTPVFAKAYFRNLKAEFGDDCEILTVLNGARPVSGVMSFHFRDEVHPYYGGGTAESRAVAGNDFMYWEVMRRAVERGHRTFDFGRSKQGTGAFDFKRHWGFEPEPLHYEYKLLKTDEIPSVNPLNPKYRMFIAAWKRLPLPVANAIGPRLARNFG